MNEYIVRYETEEFSNVAIIKADSEDGARQKIIDAYPEDDYEITVFEFRGVIS